MITKINKIHDFGIFRDFTWPTSWLPNFQRHNLFYWWNYSGKTTISRVFRSFEKQQKHIDYPGATFSLFDGTRNYTSDDLFSLPNIRVFNIDFINENLKWYSDDENQIEPIFILGEENIELQEQLSTLKKELWLLNKEKGETTQKQTDATSVLENDLTGWANSIKTSLNILTYTKTHLRQDIPTVQANPHKFILTQEDVTKTLSSILSAEQKELISEIIIPAPNLLELIEAADEILKRTISSKPIIELQENPELNVWVGKWRELNKWSDACKFCGWKLTDELFQKLDEHFSTEYSRLQQDIVTTKSKLKEYKRQVELTQHSFPTKEKMYPEFQMDFETALNSLCAEITIFLENISTLESALTEREGNLFVPNTATLEVIDNSKNIDEKLIILNKIRTQHNNKKTNFDADKNAKTKTLKNHYVARWIIDNDYFSRCLDLETFVSKIGDLKSKIITKSCEVEAIETQLSDSARWASKINEYIQQFFQHDSLSVSIGPENRFEIQRGWELAKNLSEGEKTAISLAYFMTKLDSREIDLTECIVFLDDPISSLDWNHLFNVYAFIKAKLEKCKQLFVSTHNLDFFNLMKDFIGNIPDSANPRNKMYSFDKLPYYLVQRKKQEMQFFSTLQDMPKSMKKHRTEYLYLFSMLTEHKLVEETTSHDMLYVLPNIMRRFLEWYSAQRLPWKSWKIILETLIENEVDRLKVIRFLDTYSHNQTPETAIRFPEICECQDIIQVILTGLQNTDEIHYDALMEQI